MEGKRKKTTNGKSKKLKVDLSKESFLSDIRKLKLYTEDDRYYKEVKTEIGRLELDWR